MSNWCCHLGNFPWNITCLILDHWPHAKKNNVIHKTVHIKMYCNTARGGLSCGRRQNTKFGEVSPCGFRVMRADRQTNRHTHHNTLHPSLPRINIHLTWYGHAECRTVQLSNRSKWQLTSPCQSQQSHGNVLWLWLIKYEDQLPSYINSCVYTITINFGQHTLL